MTFDWLHGPGQDLLDRRTQVEILRLIRAKAFLGCGLAPICASFSSAICPPVRSYEYLEGVPWASPTMQLKMRQGNAHCKFCVEVIKACLSSGTLFRTLKTRGCGDRRPWRR